MIFWRCVSCLRTFWTEPGPDHWSVRMDGDSRICRGPFEKWEARKLS